MANNSMKTKLNMDQLATAIKQLDSSFCIHINQSLVETPTSFLLEELGDQVSKKEFAAAYKKFSYGMHNHDLESWIAT